MDGLGSSDERDVATSLSLILWGTFSGGRWVSYSARGCGAVIFRIDGYIMSYLTYGLLLGKGEGLDLVNSELGTESKGFPW